MGVEKFKEGSEDERIRNPSVAEVVAQAEKEYQDLLRSEETPLTPEERTMVEEMSTKAGARAEKNARGLLDFEGLISGMEMPDFVLKKLTEVYGDQAGEVVDLIIKQDQAVKRETLSITFSDPMVEALRAIKRDKFDESIFSRAVAPRSTIRSWQSHFREVDIASKYLTSRMGSNSYDYQPNFLHDKLDAIYEYEWARHSALREMLYFSTLDPENRWKEVDALNDDRWEYKAPNGYGYSDEDIEQNFKDAVKIAAGLKRIMEAGSAKDAKIFEFAGMKDLTEEEIGVVEELLPMIEMNRALSPDAAAKVDAVVTLYGFVWNEKIGHYVPEGKEK